MKSAKHTPLTGVGRTSSTRAMAAIVFTIVMVGTILVVSLTQRSSYATAEHQRSAAALVQQRNDPREVGAERQAQRDKLVRDAKALLSAVEATEKRLNELSGVLGRVSSNAHARSLSAGSPPFDSTDDGDDAQKSAFPLHRFKLLASHDAKNITTSDDTHAAGLISTATIFVGVTSHRQPRCASMLSNLFHHATHPSRVYVGLVEVRGEKDPSCLPQELVDCQLRLFCITDHVRSRSVDPSEDKGLAYGRYLASLLYRGQDFVMFASTPTYASPQWDVSVISMHIAASEAQRRASGGAVRGRVVLTTVLEDADPEAPYPVVPVGSPAAADATGMTWTRATTSFLCRATYALSPQNSADAIEAGVDATPGLPPLGVPYFSSVVRTSTGASPLYQPWASTKYLFANASLLQDVPFDPHLLFIEREAEEDALYSARLWSSGWDMFSPGRSIFYQWKGGQEVAPSLTVDVPSALFLSRKKHTLQRIQYLLSALHRNTKDVVVGDDTVANEVIIDAERYAPRWNSVGVPLPSDAGGVSLGVGAMAHVPVAHRSLETWYRHSGLNPRLYRVTREWCAVQEVLNE